jgi:PIN domain nuclease of toxin-antitoxin system
MQILLDTHVLLWALSGNRRLTRETRNLLLDERNSIWISAASIWEISIKFALSRGDMPLNGRDAIRYVGEAGYSWLAVSAEHAAATEFLPAIHGDPFDRLLIAQALTEPMKLITHDAVVASYDANILLV